MLEDIMFISFNICLIAQMLIFIYIYYIYMGGKYYEKYGEKNPYS